MEKLNPVTVLEVNRMFSLQLLEWNEKERILKIKRGKNVGMRISNTATKAVLCEKAEEKWETFYSNLYYADENYLLVYEDAQIVNYLPGTKEPFFLKRGVW